MTRQQRYRFPTNNLPDDLVERNPVSPHANQNKAMREVKRPYTFYISSVILFISVFLSCSSVVVSSQLLSGVFNLAGVAQIEFNFAWTLFFLFAAASIAGLAVVIYRILWDDTIRFVIDVGVRILDEHDQ